MFSFSPVRLVTVVTMIYWCDSINFMTSVTCKNLTGTINISSEIRIRIKQQLQELLIIPCFVVANVI